MTIPEKQILKHILMLSKKLITIPSIKDNPEALREVLELAKQELQGFSIEEFESKGVRSMLVSNCEEKRTFKIILNAHLDVVPGTLEQYHPVEKDGKLYGRGAYDMKAAATVMILLYKNVARSIHYPLGLQIVTDEEVNSTNGTVYQIKKGIRAKFIITGENSGMKIKNQAKGMLWFRLKAKGTNGHGGYPWMGDNAIWKLTDVLYKLKALFPIPDKPVWKTTLNLAGIKTSNKIFNKIPDEAIAFLDIRYIPEDAETIIETIEKQLPNDVEMDIDTNDPPMLTDENNFYLQQLEKSIEKVTHKKAETESAHATSDIRVYNRVGCPGVEFGVDGANHHGDNEWVDIQSLEDYYHILKNFLLSLK